MERRFKAAFEAYLERELPIMREEVSYYSLPVVPRVTMYQELELIGIAPRSPSEPNARQDFQEV
jgi:hypothetical protein